MATYHRVRLATLKPFTNTCPLISTWTCAPSAEFSLSLRQMAPFASSRVLTMAWTIGSSSATLRTIQPAMARPNTPALRTRVRAITAIGNDTSVAETNNGVPVMKTAMPTDLLNRRQKDAKGALPTTDIMTSAAFLVSVN